MIGPGEPAPPVTRNPALTRGANDVFGVGRIRVHDPRGNHGNLQAGLADDLRHFGQVFLHALRLHVPALAYRHIESIEPKLRCRRRHFPPIQPLQVLGKINDRQWPAEGRALPPEYPKLERPAIAPAPATVVRNFRRDEPDLFIHTSASSRYTFSGITQGVR